MGLGILVHLLVLFILCTNAFGNEPTRKDSTTALCGKKIRQQAAQELDKIAEKLKLNETPKPALQYVVEEEAMGVTGPAILPPPTDNPRLQMEYTGSTAEGQTVRPGKERKPGESGQIPRSERAALVPSSMPPANASSKPTKSTWKAQTYVFIDSKAPAGEGIIKIEGPELEVDFPEGVPEGLEGMDRSKWFAKYYTNQISIRFGKEVDLEPVVISYERHDAEGNAFNVEKQMDGGQRVIFRDRVSGRFHKFPITFDESTAQGIIRQRVTGKYFQKVIANPESTKKYGIQVEYLNHGLEYATVGSEVQDELKDAMYLYDYLQTLAPKEREALEAGIYQLKKDIIHHNIIVGDLVERNFQGRHYYKKASPETIAAIEKECNGNRQMFIRRMANAGYLSDLDTGATPLEVPREGFIPDPKKDMSNARVFFRTVNGKRVPVLGFFDI